MSDDALAPALAAAGALAGSGRVGPARAADLTTFVLHTLLPRPPAAGTPSHRRGATPSPLCELKMHGASRLNPPNSHTHTHFLHTNHPYTNSRALRSRVVGRRVRPAPADAPPRRAGPARVADERLPGAPRGRPVLPHNVHRRSLLQLPG